MSTPERTFDITVETLPDGTCQCRACIELTGSNESNALIDLHSGLLLAAEEALGGWADRYGVDVDDL